jgi:hypothetical protein
MCVFRGCEVSTRVRVADCETCQTGANLRVCCVTCVMSRMRPPSLFHLAGRALD